MKQNKLQLSPLSINQDLPIIDWEQGLRLAGNKRNFAEEMLHLLAASLREEVATVNLLKEEENYQALYQRLHKLHGAVCYCGAPRLKNVIVALESAVKQSKIPEISFLLDQFESESSLLIEAVSHLSK